MAITVATAHDHPLVLDALSRVVRQDSALRLVGEDHEGRAALDRLRSCQPTVALLATEMSGFDGRRIAAAVRHDGLPTRVLLLAMGVDGPDTYDALRDGVAGVLSMRVSPDELRVAIRRAAAGEIVLGPDAQCGVAREIARRDPPHRPLLSPRERIVLGLVAEGRSAPEIGRELHLSPHTIRTNLEQMFEKLGVHERAQLVAHAMRRGLIE